MLEKNIQNNYKGRPNSFSCRNLVSQKHVSTAEIKLYIEVLMSSK